MSMTWRMPCALLLVVPMTVVALDLADFDQDVMRAMDDAFKDLEPVLGASNADIAKDDIAVLKDGYQFTHEYFTGKKAEAPDAVEINLAGQKLLGEIESAVAAKDFPKAVTKSRELQGNCRSCHDKYKPRK
jgi:cytochrome c556